MTEVARLRAAVVAWAAGGGEAAAAAEAARDLVSRARPRAVVLVEGVSDRAAVETLAERRGRDLAAEGVCVVPMGGAMSVGAFLRRLGPDGLDVRVAGLYDTGEAAYVRRGLERAGLGLPRPDPAALGFFECVADLEEELIRAVGVARVGEVVAAQGELRQWRTFCRQPAQRGRPAGARLRRFLGTTSGRKARYARALVRALDPARAPEPLDRLLAHV